MQVSFDNTDKAKLQRAYHMDKTQLSMSFKCNLSWHLSQIVSYFVITLLQIQVRVGHKSEVL